MFIKAGDYTINTNNITHIQHHADGQTLDVYFIGGQSVSLQGEAATYLLKALERNPY
jgi:hypothetical protein